MSTSTFDKTCDACHEAGLTCIKRKFEGEPCERCIELKRSCTWSQEETGSSTTSELDSVDSFASLAPVFRQCSMPFQGVQVEWTSGRISHLPSNYPSVTVTNITSSPDDFSNPSLANASALTTEVPQRRPKYTHPVFRSIKIPYEHDYQMRTLLEAFQESGTDLTPTPENLGTSLNMDYAGHRDECLMIDPLYTAPPPLTINDPLDMFYGQDLGGTVTPAQNSIDWTFGSSYQHADAISSINITDNKASASKSKFIPTLGSSLMGGDVEGHSGSQGESHSDFIPRTALAHHCEFNPRSLGSRWESNGLGLYPYGRIQHVPNGTSSNLRSNEGDSSPGIVDAASQPSQSIIPTPTYLFSPHLVAFDIPQASLNHQYTPDDFISSPYFTQTPPNLSLLQYLGHNLDEFSPLSLQTKPATSDLNLFVTNEICGGTVNPSELHVLPQDIPTHDHETGIAGHGLPPNHALADVRERANGNGELLTSAESVSLDRINVFPNFGPLITKNSATISSSTISAALSTSPTHYHGEIHTISQLPVHSDPDNQTTLTMAEEMPESGSDPGPSRQRRTSKTSTFHPYRLCSEAYKDTIGATGPSVGNSTIDHDFLDNAFSATSRYPDPILRRLFLAFKESQSYLCDQLEPILGSQEAERLLAQIEIDSCKFIIGRDRAGKSILLVFIDTTSISCLMCGKAKGSLERALGCVRAHLGYRPFWCSGASVGCKTCTTNEFKKFYSQSLLNDHLSRQASKPTCHACGKSFCRGNIARHWHAKHSEIPFPSNLYPRYKQALNQASEADKPTPISDSGYSSA